MDLKVHSFSTSTEVNKILSQNCDSLPINYRKSNEKYCHSSDNHLFERNVNSIEESLQTTESEKKSNEKTFKGKQLLILLCLAYGNFFAAACVSLQAPFFPMEAESKG